MIRRRAALSAVGFSYVALVAAALGLRAQSAVDINVGFGTHHDSASATGLDNASGAACVLTAANCQATPAMSGLFMGLGGDIMFKDHFGGGFQFIFQPTRADYGPLKYRQSFMDVNGIYAPINRKKWNVQIVGGIGAARTSFAIASSSCVGTAVLCTSQTQALGSNSHFQVHTGVGLQYFVWDKVFIKPEFDFHYVPNLTNQFGGNSVPGVMINLGYGSMRQ